MNIWTITEFEYTDYPYVSRGINIINTFTIKINDNKDRKKFLPGLDCGELSSVSYSYNGENLYPVNELNTYISNGVYKNVKTNKYYILVNVEAFDN